MSITFSGWPLTRISHEHCVAFQNISVFQEVRLCFNFSLNQHNVHQISPCGLIATMIKTFVMLQGFFKTLHKSTINSKFN
jgi:hypothetical protein